LQVSSLHNPKQPDPVDLGQTPQFRQFDNVFIIENTGDQVLIINSITIDDAIFSVIDVPSQVAPGSFEKFTVRFIAVEAGTFTANVTVSSDVGEYTFPVMVEVTELPEDPPLNVFNAVSPNGDGKHDFMRIENIEAYPDNKVVIYSKLGNLVWEMDGYDNNNSNRRFEGVSNKGNYGNLQDGTFYYWIDRGGGRGKESGFFLLTR